MQELPKERLATTDVYGNRVYLYPATVRGRYRDLRQWVHGFLVLLFLVLPWVRPHGHQLLLLDIARREFFFFGLHFRAHDAPLLLFLFLSFVFLLGLITAIWGRLWCGWACPQTVFTEFLFRRIERWIEGFPRERKALDESPFTFEKAWKKTAKWGAFTLVALIFTHSFLAYFVGSAEMIAMLSGSPLQNWPSFLVIVVTTSIVIFDFGWFREQFCIIACPYGRFQSVMLDSRSLVVGYDAKRGEPRRGTQPAGEKQGDCVDCFRCVQVCPTGIDIRRGLQMECVACTACIDACDEVMQKTQKPLGLIRYTTLAELAGRAVNGIGMRAIIYGILLCISLSGLAFTLSQKEFLDITVLRASGSPYEILSQGESQQILNHFRLDLSNQTGHDTLIEFSLDENSKKDKIELAIPLNPLPVKANAAQRLDFFIRFPPGILQNGSKKIFLHLKHEDHLRILEVSLVGPNA